ncbi:MAG: CoA pyrophosphatase [Paracoccaceae bacterium]
MEHDAADTGALRRAVLDGPVGGSSDFDLDPAVRAMLPEGRRLRAASVLIPVVERDGVLDVILTKRASHLKHHAGQIAFPGGKVEVTDASPEAAALREAAEEIGLAPADVEMIGAIDPHETVTSFRIRPFVGLVAPGFTARAQPGEVDEVFEVPLGFLMDPANLQTHVRIWKGMRRSYYAIPYGPYYIWGATARMLKALADRLRAVQ